MPRSAGDARARSHALDGALGAALAVAPGRMDLVRAGQRLPTTPAAAAWVGAGGPSDFLLEGEAVELLAPAAPASWTGAGRAKAGGPVAAGGASAAGPWHWRVPGGALAGADLAGRVAPKDR